MDSAGRAGLRGRRAVRRAEGGLARRAVLLSRRAVLLSRRPVRLTRRRMPWGPVLLTRRRLTWAPVRLSRRPVRPARARRLLARILWGPRWPGSPGWRPRLWPRARSGSRRAGRCWRWPGVRLGRVRLARRIGPTGGRSGSGLVGRSARPGGLTRPSGRARLARGTVLRGPGRGAGTGCAPLGTTRRAGGDAGGRRRPTRWRTGRCARSSRCARRRSGTRGTGLRCGRCLSRVRPIRRSGRGGGGRPAVRFGGGHVRSRRIEMDGVTTAEARRR